MLLAASLLVGCGTTPAPVIEQGRAQVMAAPDIISSNEGARRVRELSAEINQSRPSITTSSSAGQDRDLSADIERSRPSVTTSSSPAFEASSAARVQTPTATSAAAGETRISRRPIGASTANVARDDPRPGSSSDSGLNVPSNHPDTHIVQAGDTLFSIAFQYNLDFRQIAQANGLNPPYTIFVGQELYLANSVSGAPMVRAGGETGRLNAENGVLVRNPASSQAAPVSWRWPHVGRILRGFQDEAKGIDIGGNVGDPVLAAGSGDVVYSGRGVQGTGNLIIIRHSDRLLSAYAHNSAMLVPQGAQVKAGQQIAEVGVNSSGEPMLHFEIRRDGQSVDPMQFLPAR